MTAGSSDTSRRTVWTAGLLVAAGAATATAHGLYGVAVAARVPAAIAWLYPLICDGLALVAYAATSRLIDGGRRYAAAIVVLAAGLSGLAQAVYLAGGITHTTPVGLRFGVGAWPAIAAALTAHLLHLISAGDRPTKATVQPASNLPAAASNTASNQSVSHQPVQSRPNPLVQLEPSTRPAGPPPQDTRPKPSDRSPRERARAAAQTYRRAHGVWPTVNELARLAGASRGTAATVLKQLRAERPGLHVVNTQTQQETNQ